MVGKMNNENTFLKVGEVISVDGRVVKVRVHKTKNLSRLFYNGKIIKNVSVGGYVKIIKGFIKIVGKVDGEYIKEDKLFSGKDYKSEKSKIDRIIQIKMLGYFDNNGTFVRGIKELPLIFNECYLLTEDEFKKVHHFVSQDDEPLKIGVLSFEKGQTIEVGINALFASHFGVFGNTGSGKSYTLASIYRKLFEKYKNNSSFKSNARFFLLDFNGEYIGENIIIEDEYKLKYDLSTKSENGSDKYPISKEMLSNAEFWSIFLTATDKTQKPFIKRTLTKKDITDEKIENLARKIIESGNRIIFEFLESVKLFLENDFDVNELRSNLHYHSQNQCYYIKNGQSGEDLYSNSNLNGVMEEIESVLGNNWHCLSSDLSEIDKIYLKFIFYYFQEIVWGYSNQEHLAPLIKRLDKRMKDLKKVITIDKNEQEDSEKFLTIVSLKDVNLDMRKMLPLLFCKYMYEEHKKQNDNKYLNIIIDEAHNILSYESQRESEIWKDYRLETFEELIKEGRKFGVFLTIASQRPADISSTILSQLHNYFLHRLINERDIQAVERTVSYLDKVSFEYLSILPTGTCIFAGVSSNVPIIIDIDKIEDQYEPENKTLNIVENWGGAIK